MKRMIINIFILVCLVALIYRIIFSPFNWRISSSDVIDISINGHTIKDSQIPKAVTMYNNLYNVKKRNSLEGSTPIFTMTINLKSGSKIDIQDVGETKFIIDKTSKNNYKSYWAKSTKLFDFMQEYR